MTIARVIELAAMVEQGNVLPEALAIEFLSELDGMIQSDIMLMAPEEIVSYDSKNQELLLRPPHDKLYVHYLVMMIRQVQQEFEGYQNSQEMVDEKLKTFRRWYITHYRPADTQSRSYGGGTSADSFGFAYLTAYGLAVKLGYQGTEAEWLESLKGEAGAAARMRFDADRDVIQWSNGEDWEDLFALDELIDPVVAAVLEEAEGHASAAEQSAEKASLSAQVAGAAREGAETAADGARTALGGAEEAARQANSASQQSNKYAYEAMQHGQEAAAAAAEAEAAAGEAKAALGVIGDAVAQHNTSDKAHNDLRLELQALRGYVTTLLDSDDTTLDQLSEIVAYIKSNRVLLDAVATGKVNTADIINDLVTNVADRPLSAAMGVRLKNALDQMASRLGFTQADAGKLAVIGSGGALTGLGIGEGLEVKDGKLNATGGGGNGSGQNVTLTTAQIEALDGMFKVCAYDDSKDFSGAYAAFKAAFDIADSGDGGGDDPGGTGGDNSGDNTGGVSNEYTWTDGVAYSGITWEEDKYLHHSTGAVSTDEGWGLTQYLYCEGAAKIRIDNTYSRSGNYSGFFNADKVWISSFCGTPASGGADVPVPENAAYFRLATDMTGTVTITPYASA